MLIDENTTFIVQGITGREAVNLTRECLDYGIPFIASTAAAIQELVAEEDRQRVLFEPTARGVEAVLRRVLTESEPFRPASAAFDTAVALPAWADVLETQPVPRGPAERSAHDRPESFVFLGGNRDEPEPGVLETLERAQAASGADIVTCGLRLRGEGGDTLHFFHGDPGALGLLSNGYGTVGLVRRSLLRDADVPAWPLLAELTLGGARIVSVPAPLGTGRRPANLERDPAEALRVAEVFERALPDAHRPLARLAAGLAAAAAERRTPPPARRHTLSRAIRRR